MFKLLDKNKRIVLTEKFVVPDWFEKYLLCKPHLIHKNSSRETYRVILRILNGDDVTITTVPIDNRAGINESEINKWKRNPEKINIHLAVLLIEWKIISLDSGNFETKEKHYNVFASQY